MNKRSLKFIAVAATTFVAISAVSFGLAFGLDQGPHYGTDTKDYYGNYSSNNGKMNATISGTGLIFTYSTNNSSGVLHGTYIFADHNYIEENYSFSKDALLIKFTRNNDPFCPFKIGSELPALLADNRKSFLIYAHYLVNANQTSSGSWVTLDLIRSL